MNIGSILIVLALSILLVAYIAHPFQTKEVDLDGAIEKEIARLREGSTRNFSPQYCSHCGHKLNPGDRFCAQCGKAIVDTK
ncbi:MAG: zinc ribbon domain-containing protein [Chloroflexota bacterium]|nr:zinc ribbon domain-containing protein [Chloroflexota bacterium]